MHVDWPDFPASNHLAVGRGAQHDAFEESDLPYCVDLVDLHAVAPAFRALLDRDKVPYPPSPDAELAVSNIEPTGGAGE